ncbi:hypothetical protein [Pseudomonas amygdali]|uniref:Uncharacterized protein n=1 Tax=Pseudomonas amygdali pv. lachrymans str. M301315 TaxID=629260 RepID=A0AAD0PW43_PSEAV|nr:hypothetical protein [Pseudomonas amygdali]AXH59845.1 hypothetical protein PLA107_031980 [Pseudomonas amygdali pv. lachrymans str. M301315]
MSSIHVFYNFKKNIYRAGVRAPSVRESESLVLQYDRMVKAPILEKLGFDYDTWKGDFATGISFAVTWYELGGIGIWLKHLDDATFDLKTSHEMFGESSIRENELRKLLAREQWKYQYAIKEKERELEDRRRHVNEAYLIASQRQAMDEAGLRGSCNHSWAFHSRRTPNKCEKCGEWDNSGRLMPFVSNGAAIWNNIGS